MMPMVVRFIGTSLLQLHFLAKSKQLSSVSQFGPVVGPHTTDTLTHPPTDLSTHAQTHVLTHTQAHMCHAYTHAHQ